MSDSPAALQPPDSRFSIRPVRFTDVEMLREHCWPERSYATIHLLVTRAQQYARDRRGLGVVAVADDNTIQGFGQFTLWPRCGEISDLVVAPQYRRQGVATALIQFLVRVAREMHADCVEIGAALSNPAALTLYRQLGFEDSHQLLMNLGNGSEPVLFLRLQLRDALRSQES